MKKAIVYVALMCFLVTAGAADYGNVSTGERYYIYHVAGDNEYVEVAAKLGDNQVKVRDVYSGSTKIVYASSLLTKSEADNIDTAAKVGAAVVGIGVIYCLSNPNNCK